MKNDKDLLSNWSLKMKISFEDNWLWFVEIFTNLIILIITKKK